MASQSQGIQQLLAAEKRAAEKVSEARKRKARRLKQAKEEAQAEIDKFRHEKEKQFKDYEASHMGSRDDIAAKIDMDTRMKVEAMNHSVAANKEAVINQLLLLICDVKPTLHRNFRLG